REWAKVRTLWHPEGRMVTTWGGLATPDQFAAAAEEGYARGDRMMHLNAGTTVEVSGARAVAQTRLCIMQRGLVEGVLCDVACYGRDYDFVERREGSWGFVLRQPIYERDTITPVDPARTVELEPARLAKYPEGYARLAYLQETIGYPILPNLP